MFAVSRFNMDNAPSTHSSAQQTTGSEYRSSTTHKLYISHLLSTWNMRLFEFGAILFLANIYPKTLLPMSVYALARALAAVILTPFIGHYIDRTNRLIVVRITIVGQRCAVIASCLLFWAMLEEGNALPAWMDAFALLLLSLLACMEKLCATANSVSVERDWVVVIGDNDDVYLQIMNTQMRRIDLLCKLIGPLAIALIDGFSPKAAVLVMLGLNTASTLAEYGLIARVYHAIPALQERDFLKSAEPLLGQNPSTKSCFSCTTAFSGLQAYTKSAAFLPSFALSLLYLTVLSFSGQMTTYLLTFPVLTAPVVGMIRGLATIFELASTWLASCLISQIGPTRAGIWCLSFQIACLSVAVSTFFYPITSSLMGVYLLIVSVALSRIGLYGFDLVAQLIIQGSVPVHQRASFSSTEASIQNLFELITFLTTIVFPRPEQFRNAACVSFIAVCMAGGLYALYVRNRRGHLLHLPCADWAKGHWHAPGNQRTENRAQTYEMVPAMGEQLETTTQSLDQATV